MLLFSIWKVTAVAAQSARNTVSSSIQFSQQCIQAYNGIHLVLWIFNDTLAIWKMGYHVHHVCDILVCVQVFFRISIAVQHTVYGICIRTQPKPRCMNMEIHCWDPKCRHWVVILRQRNLYTSEMKYCVSMRIITLYQMRIKHNIH